MKRKNGKMNSRSLRMKTRESISAWMFLMPALILLGTFVFYPMFSAARISLHSWNLLTDMKFVGFKYYKELFSDAQWRETLGRTFKYALLYVPSLYIMSLLLALLVQKIPKGSGFFRTAYFMPVILSSVVTGLIWKLMYDAKTGVINSVISSLFGTTVPWLSSTSWAMPAVLIVHVWMQMGYYMIIFLAGLQDIPKDYYEAAALDGANAWKSFWHITMPGLANTSIFVIIMSLINSFQAYDQIAMLTNGGPANSTNLAVQTIYETAFSRYNMGSAAAMALQLFLIILVFSLIQMKLMRADRR